MKLKMSQKSLFAVLLRSPWWISLLIAATLALLAWVLLPQAYKAVGVVSNLPFVVIAAMAAWKQRGQPSPAQVSRTLQAVAAMPWPQFAHLLEQAFQRDGHVLQRRSGVADFELERSGRRMLVSARRWKTARTGLEPLRLLQAEREKSDAPDALYVSLGALSEGAAAYAKQQGITIWQAAELARALRGLIPSALKA